MTVEIKTAMAVAGNTWSCVPFSYPTRGHRDLPLVREVVAVWDIDYFYARPAGLGIDPREDIFGTENRFRVEPPPAAK